MESKVEDKANDKSVAKPDDSKTAPKDPKEKKDEKKEDKKDEK